MTSITVAYVLGYVLAVARLTRLINRDTITDWLRIAAMRRRPGVAYFLTCPWCVSVWVAAALGVWLVHLTGLDWPLVAMLGAGASYLTGLAAQLDTDEIEISVEDDEAAPRG